jgi:hypothetical protein
LVWNEGWFEWVGLGVKVKVKVNGNDGDAMRAGGAGVIVAASGLWGGR